MAPSRSTFHDIPHGTRCPHGRPTAEASPLCRHATAGRTCTRSGSTSSDPARRFRTDFQNEMGRAPDDILREARAALLGNSAITIDLCWRIEAYHEPDQ